MYWTRGTPFCGTCRSRQRVNGGARMSARYKIGLAMLTCVALGALGSEALHGQTKPPAYLIGQIDVSDPDGYAKEYLPKAREIIKAHGGRLVAAAGAAATGAQVVPSTEKPPSASSSICIRAWRRFKLGETIRHMCKCAALAKNMPSTTPSPSRPRPRRCHHRGSDPSTERKTAAKGKRRCDKHSAVWLTRLIQEIQRRSGFRNKSL